MAVAGASPPSRVPVRAPLRHREALTCAFVIDPKLATILNAAEAGSAEAQWDLGVIYREGLGVTKDPATAAAWLGDRKSTRLNSSHRL